MNKKVYYLIAIEFTLMMVAFLLFYPKYTERAIDKTLFIEILIICIVTSIASGIYANKFFFKDTNK